ncbi:condensation domain-containing protein [Actinacidiphila glaucinigra]|uniref:Phosphopantetheine attachment site n=1 Tax=Actinacidiphila glaucinigra TaxID=235986 RepID=A0A239NN71_9ACTN|nr:condensation domain-containing protein [Actinacidiphila glaucinigra]SNT56210.1 Phosphopantetheine attachment site [Actinacidiphila glaucinigra]
MSNETGQPVTGTQEILRDIWSTILKVDRIGIHDDFFGLGGDSLGTMRLLSAARKHGLKLSPADMRTHRTIAGQAQAAEGRQSAVRAEQPPAQSADTPAVDRTYPLLPIQHRFLEWPMGDHNHYNLALLAQSQEPLDRNSMGAALSALVARHDALRCRISRCNGEFVQTLAPAAEDIFPLEWHDLRDLSSKESLALRSEVAERLQSGMDLSAGPILAAAVFRSTEADQLMVIIHHMFCDGLSAAVLAEELSVLYRDIAVGATSSGLLPAATQYTEHAVAVQRMAESPSILAAGNQWLALPWKNTGRLPERDAEGSLNRRYVRTVKQLLDERTTQAFLNAPKAQGISAEEALLVAMAEAIAAVSGSSTVHFELCRHGRRPVVPHHEVTRTIGWMFTVAPYVLQVDVAARVEPRSELIEQVRSIRELEHTWGALRYTSPRSEVVDAIRALPTPELYINYRGADGLEPPWEAPLSDVKGDTGAYISPEGEQQYPIKVWAEVRDGHLELVWFYSTERYDVDVITELGRQVENSLTRFFDRSEIDAHK